MTAPEVAITFVATLLAVFFGFTLGIWWDRRKEKKARKESLSQIRYSLKSELQRNLDILEGEVIEGFNKVELKGPMLSFIRPLKTSTFEFFSGREDFKYLQPPETLAKIIQTYDQIRDFNSVMESWKHSQRPGRPWWEIDFSDRRLQYIEDGKNEMIENINEALKVL